MDVALREIYFNVNGGSCRWKNYTKRQRRKVYQVSAGKTSENGYKRRTRTSFPNHPGNITKPKGHMWTNLHSRSKWYLVDMNKFSYKNKGNRWILTVIEVLSRYAFAVPVWRKNTESMTKAVEKVLAQFKERFDRYPKAAQFDDGKEFYNVGVKTSGVTLYEGAPGSKFSKAPL